MFVESSMIHEKWVRLKLLSDSRSPGPAKMLLFTRQRLPSQNYYHTAVVILRSYKTPLAFSEMLRHAVTMRGTVRGTQDRRLLIQRR